MNCPVCRGASGFYHEFSQGGHLFRVRLCKKCLSLFQEDLSDRREHLYGESYYEKRQDYSYYDERTVHGAAALVWRSRIKNIKKYAQGGNYLDVGCAFGGLVREASHDFQAVGIDVSPYAVQEGGAWCQGTDVYGIFQADLLNLPNDPIFCRENFSVVSMVEVAEHLNKPRENFQAAFDLLAPGGMLLIQTANFEGWQARRAGIHYHYFLPGHLIYYTASGLKDLLREIGFSSFREFIPVDFGLLPKLLKSKASFRGYADYFKWLRIIGYHFISCFSFRGRPLTSSYVLYAFKSESKA